MRIDRRNFLKSSGLGVLPVCLPSVVTEMAVRSTEKPLPVNFIRDGLGLSMTETLDKLQEINRKKPIVAWVRPCLLRNCGVSQPGAGKKVTSCIWMVRGCIWQQPLPV